MQQSSQLNNKPDLTIPFNSQNESQTNNGLIQYIPVIVSNNPQQVLCSNQQQQPQYHQQNYLTNTSDENLISNLSYQEQKPFVGFVLIGLFLWCVLEITFVLSMIVGSEYVLDQGNLQIMFIILFILSFIILILILYFGIKLAIDQIKQICLLAALIVIHCISFYLFLCSFFKGRKYDSLTFGGIMTIICLIGLIVIAFCTLLVFIYSLIEQERIRISRSLIAPIICLGLSCIYSWLYIFYLPLVIIYTILLTLSLEKILQGKYNLKKNQFAFGIFCVYRTLIYPLECSQ